MTGKSSGRHDLRSHVGIGSNSQDLFGNFLMIFSTSSCEAPDRCLSFVPWYFSVTDSMGVST
ncbi:hypothetical protein ACF0H5_006540 [Mactra antiquata]